MNIFDLDDTHRNCLSSHVRLSVADLLHKNPHHELWKAMRRAADIPDQRHLISRRQAFLLLAVATHYQHSGRIVTGLERNRFANALLPHSDTDGFFTMLGEQRITAAELLDILEQELGRRPSIKTVYSWGDRYRQCPRFSKKATYTASQVNLILHYATLTRPKAAA